MGWEYADRKDDLRAEEEYIAECTQARAGLAAERSGILEYVPSRRFPRAIVDAQTTKNKIAVYSDRWENPAKVVKVFLTESKVDRVARGIHVMRYMAGWWRDLRGRCAIRKTRGQPFVEMVMPYVGESMFIKWHRERDLEQTTFLTCLGLCVGWAQELHRLHRGDLIHNDVHPGNLCVRNDRAKLCDSGEADKSYFGHQRGKAEYRWPLDDQGLAAVKILPTLGDYGSLTVPLIALLIGRAEWEFLSKKANNSGQGKQKISDPKKVGRFLNKWAMSSTLAKGMLRNEDTKDRLDENRSAIIKNLLNITAGRTEVPLDMERFHKVVFDQLRKLAATVPGH